MTTGIELIAEERARHSEEGWDAKHDQAHLNGELSIAAASFAVEGLGLQVLEVLDPLAASKFVRDAFPWGEQWDKRRKHNRKKRLIIAGSLIAAELDRMLAEEASIAPD